MCRVCLLLFCINLLIGWNCFNGSGSLVLVVIRVFFGGFGRDVSVLFVWVKVLNRMGVVVMCLIRFGIGVLFGWLI